MSGDFRDVAEVLELLDPAPWLAVLEERFGISGAVFTDYLVFRSNAQTVSIVRRGLRLPLRPEPTAVGIPFFYANMRHPRPTSAAAIKFGTHAGRNVLDLGARWVMDFVFGREIHLDDDRAAIDGAGYVLGRYRGSVVGLGHCREDGGGLVLRGMVPKAWAAQIDDESLRRQEPVQVFGRLPTRWGSVEKLRRRRRFRGG